METTEDEIIQQDDTDWIERRKHDLILRKNRLSTQRLIKEYQNQIQKQNHQIDLLMKEVKRKQFIIDTFANGNDETIQNATTISPKSNRNSSVDIVCDSEPEAIFFPNHNNSSHKKTKEKTTNSIRNETVLITTKTNKRKKSSLLSIQIQPHNPAKIGNLSNVYICDECNKPMSSRRVLAKHKRMVHCLHKEFVCDQCSKAFCVRDGLKRHLRIHTGEKPFVCRGCDKGFNQSGNMRIHEKTCKKYLRLDY